MSTSVFVGYAKPDDRWKAEAVQTYLDQHNFACSVTLLDDDASEPAAAADRTTEAIKHAQAAIFVASPHVSLGRGAWQKPYWRMIKCAEGLETPFLLLCTDNFRPGSTPPYPSALIFSRFFDAHMRSVLPHYLDMPPPTFEQQLPMLAEKLNKIVNGDLSFSRQPLWPSEQVLEQIKLQSTHKRRQRMLALLGVGEMVAFAYAALFLSFQIAAIVIAFMIAITGGITSYVSWSDLRDNKLVNLKIKTKSVGIQYRQYLEAVFYNQRRFFLSFFVATALVTTIGLVILVPVTVVIAVAIAWLRGALIVSWSANLGLIIAALVVLFLLQSLVQMGLSLRLSVSKSVDKMLESAEEPCSELSSLVKAGQITMLRKCHLGDSHNIVIDASRTENANGCLEVELQAAGVSINGDLKQTQPLNNPRLFYRWNCNYATSGKHTLNLVFRHADPCSGVPPPELMTREYHVDVITLYRQYGPALVSALVAVLAFVYALRIDWATVIHTLGI